MKLNKKILLMIMLFSLMIISTACGVEEYDITLKEDFSGSFISVSLIEDEGLGSQMTSNKFLLEEPKLKLISEEKVEHDVDGEKMLGSKRTFEFKHISDIPKRDFKIKEEKGIVTLTTSIFGEVDDAAELEKIKESYDMVAEAGFKSSIAINLPGKILETNATECKDNRVYWDLMNKELVEQGELWVKFEKGANATEQPKEPVVSNGIKEAAEFLQSKGLLKVSDKGLELDKELTRVEGALIYTRLLGIDNKVELFAMQADTGYISPFKDVPDWAWTEISYLNYEGLINGISASEFGSANKMAADQFTTLLLRAMGYSDAKGDFVWNQSVQKATAIGMLKEEDKEIIEKESSFTRGEMALIAFRYSQYKPVLP